MPKDVHLVKDFNGDYMKLGKSAQLAMNAHRRLQKLNHQKAVKANRDNDIKKQGNKYG